LLPFTNINCVFQNSDNCPQGAFIGVTEKKLLRKNPGNKNFGKMFKFSEALGQNVAGKKS